MSKEKTTKIVRLWVDGCFDMFHYGHSNAIRQAKKLFPNTYLIIGVHNDKEIMKNKGPTVIFEKDRYESVRSCKWVDEVIEDVPYNTKLKILEKYNIDYCVHGEDVSYDANGNNTYQELIDANKYVTIPRTRGVSTTNIVGRLLKHSTKKDSQKRYSMTQTTPVELDEERIFYPDIVRIKEFSDGIEKPKKNVKIVYVDGTFDLFHAGHIDFLKKAKKLGDYLIVGIHEDKTIEYYKGTGFPILTEQERLLSVLQCKYVDDVVLNAPFAVTKQLIKMYDISLVVCGSCFDTPSISKIDPYSIPKKMGIFKSVESSRPDLNISKIIEKIDENSNKFLMRNKKKKKEKEVIEEIEKNKEKK